MVTPYTGYCIASLLLVVYSKIFTVMHTVPNQNSVSHLKLLHEVSFQAETAFLNGVVSLSWQGVFLHKCRGCAHRKHMFVELVKLL